jgi:excisionase family DNA binding protein
MIKMLENKWLTATEAANLIGCSSAHVRYLAIAGHLNAEKVGPRMWLIEKKSAQNLAENPAKTGRPRKNSDFDSE